MKPFPPKLVLRFFRWYCQPDLADFIEGDLIEVYRQRRQTKSKLIADIRFIIDVLFLFRPGIIKSRESSPTLNPFTMYKNYFKVTLRVFNRERGYSLINIFGLAIGFTCCLLIYLFISDEVSYDKFHHDKERIYRVSAAYMRQGQWEPYATNSWKTSELLENNYSEIEELVRVMNDYDIFEYGDKRIIENRIAWVDPNFFKVFNFPLLTGNPDEALKGPNKVIISESTAAKYFGSENPIGKVFQVRDRSFPVEVTAVMKDMPGNSHFHFDMLISNETLKQASSEALFTNVGWDSQHIYVKIEPGASAAKMESTFAAFADKNLEFFNSKNFKLFMQPLVDIHLTSNIGLEFEENGSLFRVYTFSVIAIFILVIACVNYMNLTTARSMRRSKEVGMRKVLGARRAELLNQFLTESFFTATVAVLIAIILTALLLPEFNRFAGKNISFNVLMQPELVIGLILSVITVSLVSGFYPAVVLSSFKPLNSMKSKTGGVRSGYALRKVLVVVQFAISIGLIAASAIVFQQWDFMKNKSLGINKDMVITMPLQTMDRRQIDTFREQLTSDPTIREVGFSNMRMPGWIGNSTEYLAQDVESDDEVNKTMKIVRIEYDFFSTIEANMIEGRNFSRSFPADTVSSIIINESAVAQLKWTDAVGKWIELRGNKFNVVGVVKDFHFESVHRQIPPTIFIFHPRALSFAYVKMDPSNVSGSLSHIEKTFKSFVSNRDFEYSFVSDDIEQQYRGEQKFTQVFTLFTTIAIVIACLGTFGLISFTAERKSKEIGIRKVLGASVGDVSFMLVREFVILLLIASAIAWPVSWYFLQGWVDGFVYRTPIGAIPFVVATLLAAIIIILTTGFRALKAAVANPVESLRTE